MVATSCLHKVKQSRLRLASSSCNVSKWTRTTEYQSRSSVSIPLSRKIWRNLAWISWILRPSMITCQSRIVTIQAFQMWVAQLWRQDLMRLWSRTQMSFLLPRLVNKYAYFSANWWTLQTSLPPISTWAPPLTSTSTMIYPCKELLRLERAMSLFPI